MTCGTGVFFRSCGWEDQGIGKALIIPSDYIAVFPLPVVKRQSIGFGDSSPCGFGQPVGCDEKANSLAGQAKGYEGNMFSSERKQATTHQRVLGAAVGGDACVRHAESKGDLTVEPGGDLFGESWTARPEARCESTVLDRRG